MNNNNSSMTTESHTDDNSSSIETELKAATKTYIKRDTTCTAFKIAVIAVVLLFIGRTITLFAAYVLGGSALTVALITYGGMAVVATIVISMILEAAQ